ncbi:translocation/assembly module TamB domain-containing protein [Marinobacter sp.]|uniref:translocation/assembly module TamB domain-containing protein n=1 Tax=Marinobacter sp. TaxID=50741 RepID=UPI002B4999B9|nr:translocation/assembly module TamB domain-containing protein [Marinobacter sp.]HKK57386.1 translocation/assembly module TamB domain-containing protein [Marinobacter sp.]
MTDTRKPAASEGQEMPGARPHRLRFWLLTMLTIVVLLPLVLVSALLLALRSETGTAWVIEQVPGLTVSRAQGSLLGQWQAGALTWQGFGVGVDVTEPFIEWSPGCLLGKEVCLDRLEARAVDVSLLTPASDGTGPTTISLPDVNLPVALRIGSVDIGPLTLNGDAIWDRFRFGASGSGSDWSVSRLSIQREALELDASGRLQTRGDWPLDLMVEARLPPPEGDEWLLDLNLTGSATKLRVRGNSQGYLNASVSGRTEPLKPALPARLRVQTESFKATANLPDTLTLLDTDITLSGSLADGFRVDAKGQLPGVTSNVAMRLQGLVTTTGARKLDLRLTGQGTGDSATGAASVNGDVSWQDALSVDAKVALDAFAWFNLVPGVEPPPVVLRRFDGDVAYQDGQYNATLEAVVASPQGPANLAADIAGDMESLEVSGLRVNTGAGFLGGRARVGFAGPLTWQASLELSQFNPGYWVPALAASLNGEVTSEGTIPSEGGPSIQAAWDLQGTWQASEAELRGRLDQAGDTLVLSDLELQVDENQLSGRGEWGPVLAGEFRLVMPEPQLFLPALAGNFAGGVSISGSPESPLGSVSLTGTGLSWQDRVEVESLDLSASLSAGQTIKGDLTATNVEAVGQTLETLALDLSGTQDDHRLDISAAHREARVLLSFAGALGPEFSTWAGQLARGEIDVTSQDQFWRLNQPADLAYSQAGRLTFGKHCWMWQDASVCAGQQTLLPDPSLDYRVRKFPTTALSPLVPETLRWNTLLNADLSLDSPATGPEGSLSVNAGSGEFSVLNGDEWETFEYTALSTRLDLLPRQADLAFALEGPRLGALVADVSIDPESGERNLDGSFRISGLDIALASVFAGLEEVQGQLNGQGRISGPLMKPAVDGRLVVTGGQISDPSLPLPLNKITVDIALNGYTADLSGRWTSNERSSGVLKGTASWQSDPQVNLRLTGKRLPFQYDPYASVEIEPDLQIAFDHDGLSISGQLDVPRGSIEISKLPNQAVSVSDDEVIVGVDREEPQPLPLEMNVTVTVGEDLVSFNGFEVTGNLEGTLRIGNDMDTRGTLRLMNGRYEAYGQELELRRARLLFTGPLSEPYLDIEAIRRVDTVIAGIRLTGPVSAPQTEVFSEPEMPQTDALSYLVLGRPPQSQSQSQGEEGQIRNAAIALGLNRASGITRGIGEELGIRELTLETEGSGDQAAVVASGYLTDDLSLRYGVGLFEPFTTVALRYDLGRYFYLEAASGLAASLDIFYTRDF